MGSKVEWIEQSSEIVITAPIDEPQVTAVNRTVAPDQELARTGGEEIVVNHLQQG